MNEHEREQLQAKALDAYLTDLHSGRQATLTTGVPAKQAAFLDGLVALAEANPPDPGFASQLEARLRAVARPTYPRPRSVLRGTERILGMSRRLVFSMASAAVLALVLFVALAFLNQSQPAVGPDQLAHVPTVTSTPVPTTGPTNTPLAPTALAQGTRMPRATPTTAPTETALPTTPPTAIPTATPREPIVLPSLVQWQAGGYGGGGMGVPLPAKRTYVLDATLPESPAQMTVLVQRESPVLTASYAAQMAERLRLNGQLYQSLRLASSPDPDQEPFRGYLAVDGAHEVLFEATGIVRYTDRNRTSFYEGRWNEPQGVPPLAQAVESAETFLRSAGLLDGDYQVTATGDMIRFFHVVDGQWPILEPFATVHIWMDGQVGQMNCWQLDLDTLAEYPIISVQQAWDILRAGQPDERLWENPYRAAEMPPWGEWRHADPKFWARSYHAGQQVHLFGGLETWLPTASGDAPYLRMGSLLLTGSIQSLTEHVLDAYVRGQGVYVHVWGKVEDAGEYQALRVEGWEPAEETYWSGTIRRADGQDTLVTGDGRAIQMPDLPADLVDGTSVAVTGGQQGSVLEWDIVQEMGYAESPPEQRAPEVRMNVEQVDLAYLALAPNVVPPERYADLGYRAVQPVWRFRGHSDQGSAFEIYVQAVQAAYLSGSPGAASIPGR